VTLKYVSKYLCSFLFLCVISIVCWQHCLCGLDLLERTQSLEDTARRLTDFTENLRDLQHSLQRCEDKLASHDALGGASKDPKLLERIKVWNKYEP